MTPPESPSAPARPRRRSRPALAAALALPALALPGPAPAQGFLERTNLLDIRAGSRLSEMAEEARFSGFELSDGTPFDLEDWYEPRWPDIGVTFLTQIDPSLGVVWGFSTGERGGKYEIEPGLKLGVLKLIDLAEGQVLSISATTVLGGRLRERTCLADYGEIGGTQTVNCRLAASILPPAETLDLLFDEAPPDRLEISIRYAWTF